MQWQAIVLTGCAAMYTMFMLLRVVFMTSSDGLVDFKINTAVLAASGRGVGKCHHENSTIDSVHETRSRSQSQLMSTYM